MGIEAAAELPLSPLPKTAAPADAVNSAEAGQDETGVGRRLAITLGGGALVLNGFLAQALGVYEPAVAELSALLGALVLAAPIVSRAIGNLSRNRLDLDELIALAVVAAIAFQDYVTAGAVAFFALLGELVERRTALGARAAIESLVSLTPTTARKLDQEGQETSVEASSLAAGDRIRILPGDNVPADGVVLTGFSTIDEASITGESVPAGEGAGGGGVRRHHQPDRRAHGRGQAAGQETTLGRVKELILAAESSRPPVARTIDRYVAWYLPVVLMLSFLIFFFTQSATSFIAALVVACPTALVLATPTAMVAALSCAARLGLLIKDTRDIEGRQPSHPGDVRQDRGPSPRGAWRWSAWSPRRVETPGSSCGWRLRSLLARPTPPRGLWWR